MKIPPIITSGFHPVGGGQLGGRFPPLTFWLPTLKGEKARREREVKKIEKGEKEEKRREREREGGRDG